MKKYALAAVAAFTVLATVSTPMVANAAPLKGISINVPAGNNNITGCTNNLDDMKKQVIERLKGLGIDISNWDSNCSVAVIPQPGCPLPEKPGIEVPGIEKPEIEKPGIEVPEVEIPEVEVPETELPSDGKELTYAEQVVKLVNEERIKNGLAPVTIDESVGAAALVRAKEIEKSFSHTRPNGASFSTALKEQGVSYRGSGENIAWGQPSPEVVMNGWMNSPGHRANILNASFTKIGVGYYQNSNGTNYWTQLFTY